VLSLCLMTVPAHALPAGGYYAPIGSCDTAGYANGVAVAGNYAYVADGTALRVINVSDPTDPVEVGAYDGLTEALGVAVSGSYAYVADGTNGLWVFNISTPSNPLQVGHLAITSDAQPFLAKSIALCGAYALVGTYAQGTRFVSVANPATPVEVAHQYGPLWGADIEVEGEYAFVADLYGNLWLYDVLNPADPQAIIQWNFGGTGTYGVDAVGQLVYVSDSKALNAMDASDPNHVIAFHVNGASGRVKVAGSYVYVAWELLSHPNGGLEVLDQSTPSDPIFGYWDTAGQSRDLDVANGYVYLADGDDGLIIFPQAAPGVITGQVRIAGTTTNVGGATVEARVDGILKGSAVTAANGVYSIPNMRPNAYVVTVSAPGYITQTKSTILGVGQTAYVNFGMGLSTRITGQVKERGTNTNLQGVTVAAYLGGVLKAIATTDYNGIYLIDTTLPTGNYVIVAAKDWYIPQTKANIAVTEGETTYVNFNLYRVVLKGQVKIAGTTTALPGATVTVYNGFNATTDAGGIYEIGGVPAGIYTVVAARAGYVRQMKPNVVISPPSVTYVNFNLAVSGKLKGQVKDRVSGAPIIGATVIARMGGIVRGTAITTAPWGIYEIDSDLPAGTYAMQATAAGYTPQGKKQVPVAAGVTTYRNFNLELQ
jgi:hypothetical protein